MSEAGRRGAREIKIGSCLPPKSIGLGGFRHVLRLFSHALCLGLLPLRKFLIDVGQKEDRKGAMTRQIGLLEQQKQLLLVNLARRHSRRKGTVRGYKLFAGCGVLTQAQGEVQFAPDFPIAKGVQTNLCRTKREFRPGGGVRRVGYRNKRCPNVSAEVPVLIDTLGPEYSSAQEKPGKQKAKREQPPGACRHRRDG